MTPTLRFGWTALALFALAGCEPATSTPALPPATTGAPAAPPEAGKGEEKVKSLPVDPAKDDKKGADAKPAKLSDEEIAEIKKLPADEQAIALAQVTCPVSNDHLGGGEMGMPIKQVVEGKTFFLCCAGCEKAVKADPAAILAKLKK